MTVDANAINEAIKNALAEQYKAAEIWDEDKQGYEYRLVFESEKLEGRAHRATVYIDIGFDAKRLVLIAQDSTRETIRIDCAAPNQFDKLDKFIMEYLHYSGFITAAELLEKHTNRDMLHRYDRWARLGPKPNRRPER